MKWLLFDFYGQVHHFLLGFYGIFCWWFGGCVVFRGISFAGRPAFFLPCAGEGGWRRLFEGGEAVPGLRVFLVF